MTETQDNDAAIERAAVTSPIALAQPLAPMTPDLAVTEQAAPGEVDGEIEAALAAYVLPLAFTPVGIALARADLSAERAAGDDASEELKARAACSRDWLARVLRGEVVLTDNTGKTLPQHPLHHGS